MHRSGRLSRPVSFPIQPSCAPWPMLWRFDTTGSPPWLFSAGRLGSSRNLPAAAPDQPGYWRPVLTIPYAHLHRKGVSQIKTKEGTGLKRLNVNISEELHRRFKSATAAQGLEMTDVILEWIQKYVDKNGLATP